MDAHARQAARAPYSARVIANVDGQSGQPMRTKTLGFDEVRDIAMTLPDVEDSTIHGAPSLKVVASS